ncbi:MAG: hypothetical protein HYW50_04055 [Candidatus Diapherotrites archaeon]|nr:hypothetical protein [Candidatus Diapherotrites archaeon]
MIELKGVDGWKRSIGAVSSFISEGNFRFNDSGRALPREHLKMDVTDSELLLQLVGEFEKSFRLPLIDVSDEELALPKHKYECSVEINARVFKEALKDASIFGSVVVLKTSGDQLIIEARGSNGQLVCVSKDKKLIKVNGSTDVVAKFSLNFLQNVVREASPEGTILLELKTDSPMKVSYNINKNEMRFFLAHMLL